MTANEDPNYNAKYPEKYNWSLLDSPTLEKLATILSRKIEAECLFRDRPFTGGLRCALNEIANLARL